MASNNGRESAPSQIGLHTLRPFIVEYSLMAELREVHRRGIPGMYVSPSAESALVWFSMLIVRSGCYVGGLFKFILVMQDGHPHATAAPAVIFQPPVFHPLVDMVTGQMNCATRFPKWSAQSNSIAELLEFVKDAFYQVQTEGSVNPEASLLYARNASNFEQRAGESVQYCRSRLLDTLATVRSVSGEISEDIDPHTFPTFLIEGALLEESKRTMMAEGGATSPTVNDDGVSDACSVASSEGAGSQPACRGLSWVKPGTAVAFSQTDTKKS